MAAQSRLKKERDSRMKKRILAWMSLILWAAAAAGCHGVPVGAAEQKIPPYLLDIGRPCAIEIHTEGTPKTAGEKLAVYQVGRIDATSLSLSFVACKDFEEAHVDLLATESAKRQEVIETLQQYASNRQIQPEQVVTLDETGAARLEVAQGAYLIFQIGRGEAEIQPTLVSLPCVNRSLDEWIYEADVTLKAIPEAPPTGDWSNGLLYAGLAGAAGLALALLILARKRGKRK